MPTSLRVGSRMSRVGSPLGRWLAWTVLGMLAALVAALLMRQRTPLLVVVAISGLALVFVLLWRMSLPGRATNALVGLGAWVRKDAGRRISASMTS
jgi:hypothetical protein